MTSKHTTAEWQRTARLIRAQVKRAWATGQEVLCWRCGRPIHEDEPFDVGHLDPFGGEAPDNAAPEHRTENRRAGGRMGARITNAARGAATFIKPPWLR